MLAARWFIACCLACPGSPGEQMGLQSGAATVATFLMVLATFAGGKLWGGGGGGDLWVGLT